MSSLIPPLDFSRSPDSFTTALEAPSLTQANSEGSRSSLTASLSPSPNPAVEASEGVAANAAVEAKQVVDAIQAVEAYQAVGANEEVFVALHRSNTVSSQRKKLVKRNPKAQDQQLVERSVTPKEQQLVKRTQSVKLGQVDEDGTKSGAKSYRCDIHTNNGADFRDIEARSKQLVLEAGGKVIDEFAYPGGFLYQMPPNTPNPLQSGSVNESGGHLDIGPWTHFPRALFNGLKLAPYGKTGGFLILPVPPHRSLPVLEKAWPRGCDSMAKRRVSLWLGEMARNYGSGVRYMT